ncbi:MAG: alanine racemase [Eubacterium sp.]|nr:alanine racemase [Eubacterium sp.]
MKNNKYYRVYAEINLDAIVKNVDNLMALTKENTGALAVVKADGYGHGDVAVAKAVAQKVTGYAVATLDEAVNLRENGVKKPILVLGYVDPYEFDILVSHEITATVFDVETAQLLADAARVQKKQAHCHIKVDTGMRRIGLEPDENGIAIVKQITALKELSADGIFTHFAASDETDKTSAEHQFKLFTDFTGRLEKEGIHFTYRHCANSAAVIDMPQVDLDMVRLGIAMYGMYPSDEVKKEKVELFPALDLKSHITMVKEIPAGEKVSYGGTFTTTRTTKLATVSVGYGDGYPRALSSKGYVLVRGQKAPIVGRVCMDQMMVDVTDIENVTRADIVTLIGKDGDAEITVEEIASLAGTFNYEFVCDLGKRIPRSYYLNGEYIGTHDCFRENWNLKNL